jgi:hypothetical protein
MYFCSKENKIIMRKSFIAIIILILCVAGIDIILPRNDRPFADQLKEAINTCELTTYTDDDFGFAAEYPQFFTQEDQTDDEYVGHARFSYWDHWMRIVMECYVTQNDGQLSVRRGMHEHARRMHARRARMGHGWFILSGPLYENGNPVCGYSYHIKYVRNGNLWFVYALYYPDEYRPCVARLFRIIDRWTVWDNTRPLKLDFRHHRKFLI